MQKVFCKVLNYYTTINLGGKLLQNFKIMRESQVTTCFFLLRQVGDQQNGKQKRGITEFIF